MFTDIIWDFDGTLFDTYPGMVSSFMETLKEEGIQGNESEILDYMKVSLGYAIDKYSEKYTISKDFRKRFDEKDKRIAPEERLPYHFSREICREIIDRGGRNFLITHRGNSTLKYIKHHNMEELFVEIVTKHYGFKRKPDPEAFIYLLNKHSINRSEALGIGDRELDVQAAKNSGIKTCLFKNYNIKLKVEADFVITSLKELYNFIK